MLTYLPIILIGLLAVGLFLWSFVAQLVRRRAQKAALEQLGFKPCLDKKIWLEETVTRIENNRGFRYEVREPKRLAGEPAVYYYIKIRHGGDREDIPLVEEEILFPLKRAHQRMVLF
jgi:hypothetical protein